MNSQRRFEAERRTSERHRQSAGEPDGKGADQNRKRGSPLESGAWHGLSPTSPCGEPSAPIARLPPQQTKYIERPPGDFALDQRESAAADVGSS